VPSYSILPEARRAALEAAIDEALTEVREASDVALLQECRAVFRSRVPLHLRAYVAAAMALKGSSGQASRRDDERRRKKPSDQRRAEPSGATVDKAEGGRAERKARGADKAARAVAEASRAERPEGAARDRESREKDNRENRYQGEGVTLFVSAGRRQRFYARIAVKVIAEAAGVGEASIGDVRTMDNYSFVVVAPEAESAVVAALSGFDWKGRSLTVNRARKRGESAPEERVVGEEGDASADLFQDEEPAYGPDDEELAGASDLDEDEATGDA